MSIAVSCRCSYSGNFIDMYIYLLIVVIIVLVLYFVYSLTFCE